MNVAMAGDRSARPTPLMLVLLVPVVLLATAVLAWTDSGRDLVTPYLESGSVVATGHATTSSGAKPGMALAYGYGFPMDWLLQYAPYNVENDPPFRDPRHEPTIVALVPLVVDLVLVYLLLLGSLWVMNWLFVSGRKKPRAGT